MFFLMTNEHSVSGQKDKTFFQGGVKCCIEYDWRSEIVVGGDIDNDKQGKPEGLVL